MQKTQKDYIFTSESVTIGHPDKLADQISDGVLDYILERDKNARVAVETLISNGVCLVAGELKTDTYVPLQTIARKVMKEVGYDNADYGCDYKSYGVMNAIGEQSNDINQGVDKEDGEIGAGDQGLMFGFACNETSEFMPLPISLAHKLTNRLTEVRKRKIVRNLRPDGKAQVSIKYKDGVPIGIDTIVLSAQHDDVIDQPNLQKILKEHVIDYVINKNEYSKLNKDNITYHINPTGRFVIGGPQGDAGLTGRKIIVDTYGGYCPHGGGAFSGKDPTKVDRSGAYISRYIAKNLVAAGVAEKITIQLAYAIGVAEPVSVYIDDHGTLINNLDISQVELIVSKIFDLTPKGIIKELNLLEPIYLKTSQNGHFGNSEFPWEQIDKISEIKSYLGL